MLRVLHWLDCPYYTVIHRFDVLYWFRPITLKAVQYDVESMSSCVFVFWHRPVFGTPRKYESSDGCGTGDYSGGRQVGWIAYLGLLCNRAACSGRLAYTRSPTHSLVNSLIYPLTPPPARSLTHSPNHHPTTHSLTHSPACSLNSPLTLTHARMHELTRSLTHWLTHVFAERLADLVLEKWMNGVGNALFDGWIDGRMHGWTAGYYCHTLLMPTCLPSYCHTLLIPYCLPSPTDFWSKSRCSSRTWSADASTWLAPSSLCRSERQI